MATIDNTRIHEKIREIKQSFRLLMNGVTAQSMREKGVDYHINWGASLMHLKEMAAEYEKDKELAAALWKENVRECKIMATLLMPPNEMSESTATTWIEDTHTQEIAEIATMNLYQHLPYASRLAKEMISREDDMAQIQGYSILSRVFAKNTNETEKDLQDTFIAYAIKALQSKSIAVKHCAWNAMVKFANIDSKHNATAKNALKPIKMDDWL